MYARGKTAFFNKLDLLSIDNIILVKHLVCCDVLTTKFFEIKCLPIQ